MKAVKTPYVKQFDENGVITNPITKQDAYIHNPLPSRQMRRGHVRVIPMQVGQEMIFITQRKAKSSKKWYNV